MLRCRKGPNAVKLGLWLACDMPSIEASAQRGVAYSSIDDARARLVPRTVLFPVEVPEGSRCG